MVWPEPVDDLGDLARVLGGDTTSFTGELLRLIAKARSPQELREWAQARLAELRSPGGAEPAEPSPPAVGDTSPEQAAHPGQPV